MFSAELEVITILCTYKLKKNYLYYCKKKLFTYTVTLIRQFLYLFLSKSFLGDISYSEIKYFSIFFFYCVSNIA